MLFLLLSLTKLYIWMQRCICLLTDRFIQFRSESASDEDEYGDLSRTNLAALLWRTWIESIRTLLFLSPQTILAYSSTRHDNDHCRDINFQMLPDLGKSFWSGHYVTVLQGVTLLHELNLIYFSRINTIIMEWALCNSVTMCYPVTRTEICLF